MPDNGDGGNNWPEHRRQVLAEQERVARRLEHLEDQVEEARREIVALQVKAVAKAGVIGFIAGMIPTAAAILFRLFTRS